MIRVAIQTKFIGPTNYRPSRVKATPLNGGKSLTVSWDYALGVEENHRAAALALVTDREWFGHWAQGGGKDGDVFVCVTSRGEDCGGFTVMGGES